MAGYNKTKTTPFRLLAYLLYGTQEWIEVTAPGKVRIQTGPASRALRTSTARLWEQLFWIDKMGLATVDKARTRGVAEITIHMPRAHTGGKSE